MTMSASAAATSRAFNTAIVSTLIAVPRKHGRGSANHSRSRASSNRSASLDKATLEPSLERKCAAPDAEKLAKRDRLVLETLPLVKAIANSIRNGLPVHADDDDLLQAGMMGLIDAADRFDAKKETSFSTYAKFRIRGAILDSLRQLDWASRDMRRRQKLVAAAMSQLTSEFERAPTETEVAERLGMDLLSCRRAMTDLHNGAPVSSSHFGTNDRDCPVPDFASGPETQPDFICGHEQMRGALDEVVKTLPERYQKVVLMYYTKDMSMKEIGSELKVNESRVSQIHKAALARMAVALKTNGIASHRVFID